MAKLSRNASNILQLNFDFWCLDFLSFVECSLFLAISCNVLQVVTKPAGFQQRTKVTVAWFTREFLPFHHVRKCLIKFFKREIEYLFCLSRPTSENMWVYFCYKIRYDFSTYMSLMNINGHVQNCKLKKKEKCTGRSNIWQASTSTGVDLHPSTPPETQFDPPNSASVGLGRGRLDR